MPLAHTLPEARDRCAPQGHGLELYSELVLAGPLHRPQSVYLLSYSAGEYCGFVAEFAAEVRQIPLNLIESR